MAAFGSRDSFLGIDGGGTKTAFVLVDSSGSVIARAQQPSSDYYRLGVKALTQTLADGVGDICRQGGICADEIDFTVVGIIRSFNELGQAGSASLRAVGPGISDALLATAVGLAAAIPAAFFYNHFAHILKEIGARMDDFSTEFMNMAERSFEE